MRLPDRLVVAGDVVGGDHHDMRVGQEVQRRRIVLARDEHRACRISATPAKARLSETASLPSEAPVSRSRCGSRSQGRLASTRSAPVRICMRQIVAAQMLGDRGRHVVRRRRAARRWRRPSPPSAQNSATRPFAVELSARRDEVRLRALRAAPRPPRAAPRRRRTRRARAGPFRARFARAHAARFRAL